MVGMKKTSAGSSSAAAAATMSEKGMRAEYLSRMGDFLQSIGTSATIHPQTEGKYFFSDFVGGLLKVDCVDRGRVSCLLTVEPAALNSYGGLHGGAIASLAEMVSIACARTVVGKDKELFLGELSTSYLSAAPCSAELKVDASVVRSGRNLTVVAVEFKIKDSGRLAFTSRATFYNMLVASL